MADIVCPQCQKKEVVVKQAKTDRGDLLKYFECKACRALWTNTNDIPKLPVEA